jgi:hypothetical protein
MKVLCKFCGFDYHSPTKDLECPSCGSTKAEDFIFSANEIPPTPKSEMMYEVEYTCYSHKRHEQIVESRLQFIRKRPDVYSDIKVIRELGMQNTEWLLKWYELGLNNYWIARAYDPKFTLNAFFECKTLDYLMEQLKKRNWCVGTAFYYKNICFIEQVSGGDEWLVIRDDIPFESYSAGYVIEREPDKFKEFIERVLRATPEQLRNLEY